MLEAHFMAMQNVVKYLEIQAKNDLTAARVLKKFVKNCKNEGNTLDPVEAIFGFAAMLGKLNPSREFGHDKHPQELALLAGHFAQVNNLGQPSPGYAQRLVMPSTGETESNIIMPGKG